MNLKYGIRHEMFGFNMKHKILDQWNDFENFFQKNLKGKKLFKKLSQNFEIFLEKSKNFENFFRKN